MKSRKKYWIIGFLCLLTICFVMGGAGLFPKSTGENVVTFAPIEAKETYGLGESITVQPIEAVSEGKKYMVSGLLSFDEETCVFVSSDNKKGVEYVFSKTGEYILTYSLNIDGTVYTSSKLVKVEDKPYFTDTLKSRYPLGSELPIEDIYGVYGNEKVKAKVFVNGDIVEEYRADSLGTLEVVLSAFINQAEQTETRTVEIYLNSYADLFIGDNIETDAGHAAPEWMHKQNGNPYEGVLITSDQLSGTVRFSNVIDLNYCDPEEALIKFISVSGTYEGITYTPLSSISIKLIDIYDSGNYVTFRNFSSMYYEDGSCNLYSQICYDDIVMARWNFGDYSEFREYLINFNSTLDINAKNNSRTNILWLSLSLDYATRNFYTNLAPNEDSEPFNILNAGDPKIVGAGNQWKGFTTGEVYLEIEFESTGRTNGIFVREIAGQELSGSGISDAEAPQAIFEYNEFPIGYTGRRYPIPYPTKILDAVQGVLGNDYCDVELCLVEGNKYTDLTQEITDGVFVPEKAGTYQITYTIWDDSKNVRFYEKNFEIYADSVKAAAVNPLAENYFVGTKIVLPDITVENMSLIVEKDIEYRYDGQVLSASAGDALFFDKPGTLEISYRITDYNGTMLVGVFSAGVIVSEEPIVTIESVSEVAISGLPFYLPVFEAYDYNYPENDERFVPQKNMSINGKMIPADTQMYDVTEADGEQLVIRYTVGAIEKEVIIPVIKAEYLSDYFTAVSSNGEVTKINEADSLQFSFNRDAEISPINPCVINISENILVRFAFSGNQGMLKLSFVDYVDENKVVEFLYDFENGTLTNSGVTYELEQGEINVGYNAAKRLSSGLCVVTEWSDGTEFSGFNNDLYKIKFKFENCAEDALLSIYRLSASDMGTKRNDDGTLETYSYNGVPYLVLNEEIEAGDIIPGEQLKVPRATAWLPFGGMLYVEVAVESFDGESISETMSALDDNYVTINKYGQYLVEYKMHTPSGRIRSVTYSVEIRCFELPQIIVRTEIGNTYKLGDTIEGIDFSVNGEGETSAVILLVDGKGKITRYASTDVIVLDTVGTNKLVILANDAWNYATKIFTFEVTR